MQRRDVNADGFCHSWKSQPAGMRMDWPSNRNSRSEGQAFKVCHALGHYIEQQEVEEENYARSQSRPGYKVSSRDPVRFRAWYFF